MTSITRKQAEHEAFTTYYVEPALAGSNTMKATHHKLRQLDDTIAAFLYRFGGEYRVRRTERDRRKGIEGGYVCDEAERYSRAA